MVMTHHVFLAVKILFVGMNYVLNFYACYSSTHFYAFLYISMHFYAFLCISMHFYTFLCISMHFYTFLCISIHFYTFLCISTHFYTFLCISMHFYTRCGRIFIHVNHLKLCMWMYQTEEH